MLSVKKFLINKTKYFFFFTPFSSSFFISNYVIYHSLILFLFLLKLACKHYNQLNLLPENYLAAKFKHKLDCITFALTLTYTKSYSQVGLAACLARNILYNKVHKIAFEQVEKGEKRRRRKTVTTAVDSS